MTASEVLPGARSSRFGFVRSAIQRAAGFVGTVAAPALGAVLMLRFVFPTRLAGAGGGATGFLAWLGDQHPLFAGVALFVGFSETGRYWWGRWHGVDRVGAKWRSGSRFVLSLAAIVVLAFVVRSSVAAIFRVVGPSMLPTLEVGDRLLVNRLAYGVTLPFSRARLAQRTPARGELVVFRAEGLTGADGPQSIVKRVLGVPGDRISVEQGALMINDWTIPSCDAGPYANLVGKLTVRGRLAVEFLGDDAYLTVRKPIEAPFPGYVVKPGEVFLVGDDRGLSSDSRLWSEAHGTGVPIDILQGRVSRILLGARPDGGLDFSRLLAPPLGLKVRLPGFDMRSTDERIANCLSQRPAVTSPPPPSASTQ